MFENFCLDDSMRLSVPILSDVLLETSVSTLMQSYKRTPNIFYASSKSKNQLCIFFYIYK